MSPDSTRQLGDQTASLQRLLSLFLRSEREIGFPDDDPSLIRNFSGAMDEFCLFSRALNADEIRALYSVGKPQPDPVAALNKN